LLVVLDALAPPERLAFVLHDIFAVPFDEIASIVERSPAATRQLASRARRRVQAATPFPHADLREQRELVDAFLAASREGDFEALIAVLDPDVVLRVDAGAAIARGARFLRGAPAVARQSVTFARSATGEARPALVNGAAGVVFAAGGQPFAVVGFTIRRGKIVEIDVLADPERLRRLGLVTPGD
jgi:RNA polymerase sigma-70 factor, ECF subfamily